jgi:hypothetical protein
MACDWESPTEARCLFLKPRGETDGKHLATFSERQAVRVYSKISSPLNNFDFGLSQTDSSGGLKCEKALAHQ